MNQSADIFETCRPQLFALAYRMLGEKSGAEDVVQDAWMRWSRDDRSDIKVPIAWLKRTTARLAIDALKSARARREVYVGPWLPEPLVREGQNSGEDILMLAEECELALLWAMERLSPEERAAFILRKAFDTPYTEIARLLGKTETTCRQIVSRANRHIKSSGTRFEATNDEVSDLLSRFMEATVSGNKSKVMELFSPGATALSDGGGKARAALRPLVGPGEIADVILAIARKQDALLAMSLGLANGRPALVINTGGANDMVLSLTAGDDGKINWLYIMRNPDKLPSPPSAPDC